MTAASSQLPRFRVGLSSAGGMRSVFFRPDPQRGSVAVKAPSGRHIRRHHICFAEFKPLLARLDDMALDASMRPAGVLEAVGGLSSWFVRGERARSAQGSVLGGAWPLLAAARLPIWLEPITCLKGPSETCFSKGRCVGSRCRQLPVAETFWLGMAVPMSAIACTGASPVLIRGAELNFCRIEATWLRIRIARSEDCVRSYLSGNEAVAATNSALSSAGTAGCNVTPYAPTSGKTGDTRQEQSPTVRAHDQ